MEITFTLNPAFTGATYVAGPFDISGTTCEGDTYLLLENVPKENLITGVTFTTVSNTITGGTISSGGECSGVTQPWQTGIQCEQQTGGQLSVYAKFINAENVLQYSVNMNTPVTIGNIDSLSCTFYDTITGLTSGDSIQFTTTTACAINGDTSTCPNTTPGISYTYNFTGTDSVYITVNGGDCA